MPVLPGLAATPAATARPRRVSAVSVKAVVAVRPSSDGKVAHPTISAASATSNGDRMQFIGELRSGKSANGGGLRSRACVRKRHRNCIRSRRDAGNCSDSLRDELERVVGLAPSARMRTACWRGARARVPSSASRSPCPSALLLRHPRRYRLYECPLSCFICNGEGSTAYFLAAGFTAIAKASV